MPEQPLSPGRRGRHGAPVSRRAILVAWLLGLLWLAGFIAGFFIGGSVAEATVAPARPPVGAQDAGLGPALVGTSAVILVAVAGAQISILRDRRRRPNATYNAAGYRPHFPAWLALRYNARLALISIPIAALGLWLTHLYG